jgi:hypothetical protein
VIFSSILDRRTDRQRAAALRRGIAAGDASAGAHFAVGWIHYDHVDPDAKDGVIVYLKASLSGDEPVDVVNYAKAHPEFPNESTADQWFTEAQFESYRALGQHMVGSLVAQPDAERISLTIEDFFDAARGGAAARAVLTSA